MGNKVGRMSNNAKRFKEFERMYQKFPSTPTKEWAACFSVNSETINTWIKKFKLKMERKNGIFKSNTTCTHTVEDLEIRTSLFKQILEVFEEMDYDNIQELEGIDEILDEMVKPEDSDEEDFVMETGEDDNDDDDSDDWDENDDLDDEEEFDEDMDDEEAW